MVPFEKNEEIGKTFGRLRVLEVILTTDANLEVVSKLVDLILVTNSEHLLVLIFLVRVVPFEFGEFLRLLGSLEQVDVNLLSFLHELTGTVDGIIIKGSVIGKSSLGDGLHVEHVLSTLLVSLVNEEHVLELLDADIPRVVGLGRAHNGGSSLIGDEDVGLLVSGELLDDLILKDGSLGPGSLLLRDFLGSEDVGLLVFHVELVDLTCFLKDTELTWGQGGKFVLSLLGELNENGPLGFDLIGWLSETSALEATRMETRVTGLVGALGLLLPLLSLTSHLRSLMGLLQGGTILLVLSDELALMDVLGVGVVSATTVLILLVVSALLLLDDAELGVFLGGDQVGLGGGTSLLLLLHDGLSGRDKGSVGCGCEVTESAHLLLLVVRLEQLAIELVFEVKGVSLGSEVLALEVEAKTAQIEICAQKLIHLNCVN